MKIILTGFTYLLAALGYLLNYVNKRELRRRRVWFLVVGLALTTVVIWGGYYYDAMLSVTQGRESEAIRANLDEIQRQNDEIRDQNTLLLVERDSLKAHVAAIRTDMGSIREDNQRLNILLGPFLQRARLNYPGLGDQTALQELASDVAKMKPKMIHLEDRTRQWKDHSTNLLHTVYFFRPQYSVGVWDVSITLAFDKPFVSANARIGGGIVEDQGSRLTIASDSTGLSYATVHLREGNYIQIEVQSHAPVNIILRDLKP